MYNQNQKAKERAARAYIARRTAELSKPQAQSGKKK